MTSNRDWPVTLPSLKPTRSDGKWQKSDAFSTTGDYDDYERDGWMYDASEGERDGRSVRE